MEKNSVQFLIIGLIVGFIAGALAVDRGIILSSSKKERLDDVTATSTKENVLEEVKNEEVEGAGDVNTQETRTTSGVVLSGKNTVDVEDQPAGNSVKISSIVLNEMGWVVIHEDASGKPGNVLGAALVFAGEHSLVPVELLRNTEKGKTYHVVLHTDNGDRVFDLKKDFPITDSAGNVQMLFTAE